MNFLLVLCLVLFSIHLTHTKECIFSPEIVLAQDVSGSYEDDLVNLNKVMPDMFKMLKADFPGTKFGITSFVDASGSCGHSTDWCASLHQSLNDPGATVLEKTQHALSEITAGGGRDVPENFLGGVVRTLLSPKVGWSPPGQTHTPEGLPIIRILIATTDAVPHESGDKAVCAKERNEDKIFHPMPTSSSEWLKDDINAGCTVYEYPKISDLIKIFEERKILPVFLFGNAGERLHRAPSYKNYASKYGYFYKEHPEMFSPSETALTRLMAAIFNEKFNFFPEISTIDATMSDFALKMKVALQSIVEKVCKYGTTEIPTTVKPEPTSDASDTTSTISTGSTENHQGGSTQSSTATATTTSNGAANVGIIVGSATAGVAAVVGVIAGAGFLWNRASATSYLHTPLDAGVESPDLINEREVFEPVTVELFS